MSVATSTIRDKRARIARENERIVRESTGKNRRKCYTVYTNKNEEAANDFL
jgi:hypothetical protein